MSIAYGVFYSVETLTSDEIISDSRILLSDQTSLPFTFYFNDARFMRMRSSVLQLLQCQLFTVMKEFLPYDSLHSYGTVKSFILDMLLHAEDIEYDPHDIERLKEEIAIIACDTFRANRAKKVRTLGFNVVIDIVMIEDEASMDMGPSMVPASQDSIEKLLNTKKFEREEIGDEVCSVCLEEFSLRLDQIKVMPCGHAFHGNCIIKWLQKSHFCPLCRFSMPVDDAD
ncbi:hypothetical protein NE237_022371 [Protea cynaroides]|uniref:RING-type domain-containing protein n=1 Tax=Protea cynaroides TaxID=273540 RepID=A0A9Q0K4E5_9MAGN|nr:hypothetical protein NE237_022371 [Protea cynaroides]